MTRFKDRADGGKKLAVLLASYVGCPNAIVIGLARGGIVTAYQVADLLCLPLDVVVPRKISAPMNPELGVGALTQEGTVVWNSILLKKLGLTSADLAETIKKEKKELIRRLRRYRGGRQPLKIKNKTVILVDDGIATGATMRAAIVSVRVQGAKKIIVAVPVSPPDALQKIKKEADKVFCLFTTKAFLGIGDFYDIFTQTEDKDVIMLLQKRAH